MGKYSIRIDITNQRFGKLIALEAVERSELEIKKGTHLKWKCLCDCGNIKHISTYELRKGVTKSCGCYKSEFCSTGNWKGFEKISSTYFSSIKRGALNRGLEFSITIEEIWNLYIKQNKLCCLSGEEIVFYERKSNRNTQTASLDRIDSNKGYTINNIQWVHKNINMMKQELSDSKFLEWCDKVSNFNRRLFNEIDDM
jgi:hypothetical protein